MFLKLGDAGVGRAHTPRAFEHEGFGHDADGQDAAVARRLGDDGRRAGRSEEHTSELQSLMRISYAVFCLKNNTTTTQIGLILDPRLHTPHIYAHHTLCPMSSPLL